MEDCTSLMICKNCKHLLNYKNIWLCFRAFDDKLKKKLVNGEGVTDLELANLNIMRVKHYTTPVSYCALWEKVI